MSTKEKHLFVEDDILAEKSLKGEFDDFMWFSRMYAKDYELKIIKKK